MPDERTLADRLGVTTHVSPLRRKVERLAHQYPIADAVCLEDWLLDVANARGATVVSRSLDKLRGSQESPPPAVLSNSELVAAICLPHNLDRPQWLRAAAQLISRGDIDPDELTLIAKRERLGNILAELAKQALRVAPDHQIWQRFANPDQSQPPLRDSLIHWTRLAKAVGARPTAGTPQWKLVG